MIERYFRDGGAEVEKRRDRGGRNPHIRYFFEVPITKADPEPIGSLGSTILSSGCENTDSTDCESAIQDALLAADYDIQSRAVGSCCLPED